MALAAAVSQLDLTGAEHPLEKPELTERQQFALDTLRQLGFAQAVEIGAALHFRRGRHTLDAYCTYCSSEGTSVLRALKRKGLVRQRRGGVFEPLEESGRSPVPRRESSLSSSGPTAAGVQPPGTGETPVDAGAAHLSQLGPDEELPY